MPCELFALFVAFAPAPFHRSAGSLRHSAGRVDACAPSQTLFAVAHRLRHRTWLAAAAHTLGSGRRRPQSRPMAGPLPGSSTTVVVMKRRVVCHANSGRSPAASGGM